MPVAATLLPGWMSEPFYLASTSAVGQLQWFSPSSMATFFFGTLAIPDHVAHFDSVEVIALVLFPLSQTTKPTHLRTTVSAGLVLVGKVRFLC